MAADAPQMGQTAGGCWPSWMYPQIIQRHRFILRLLFFYGDEQSSGFTKTHTSKRTF
jgi:hypothetical protein